MGLRQRLAIFSLAFLFPAAASRAQQHPLPKSQAAAPDSVVADSTEYSDPLLWRLDAAEMFTFIHEDIGDLLRFLPGAYAADRGRLGQLSLPSIRGSTGAEALVLLGDAPLGDSFDRRFDLAGLPVLPIQSLGVYRTGAFLPYGQSALGGALRLQPKRHRGQRPFSIVRVRDGYYGYDDVEVRYSQAISRRATVALGGGVRDVTAIADQQDIQNPEFPGHTGENWYIDLRLTPWRRWDVRYLVLHTRNDAGVASAYLPEGIVGEQRRRKEVRTDHSLAFRSGDDRSSVAALLYASAQFREYRQRYPARFLVHKGRTAGLALERRLQIGGHELSWGGAVEREDLRGDVISTEQNFARIYLRDRLDLAGRGKFGLQLGLEKRGGYTIFPSLAGHLLWSLNSSSWLWMGGERARRYPAAMERLWPGDRYLGDPALRPESGWAMEIGGAASSANGSRLKVAAFYRAVNDWLGISVADTVLRPANLGRRRLVGADLDLRLVVWRRTAVGGVGQWLRVVESDPLKRLDLPDLVLNGYAEAAQTFFHDLDVTGRLFVRLLGERWSMAYLGPEVRPVPVPLSRELLVDWMVILRFKDARIFFSMEDAFHRGITEVWGYRQIGRTFRWGIDWQFFD
jgi:outer membrane cobalamin receptor